ncbi:regulation of nuclear pre-mRNA domain-containing protein 1B-like [Phalaenopsis equestris]|uniref:regulation of nuclear pre-mRNA domain-containing protein 1B-like n=1 Tax=Phalaenopsis equestris TaxID=78828 RepID=UPI0009E3933B|nr:regulation of nuclear pre-mRNA domain-containing protein 1B-like [Phalaenopsis equestris]XP_020581833.1 regulation of nuclear pre-mRNA domain-containing protein 1B-like [Phalaenopsis equestris]XP_020581834.1 regulation of nuclear pre-mRNA domain-containing protein 1B-like [Phalaenopsis equestris]
MNSVFSEQILADKLSKLNSTQQCIETLSHWCIFHRKNAEQVVQTWEKQFHSSTKEHKIPFLYLANDILQNSRRNGMEFVGEFWKVLPSALKDVTENGDDHGKTVVSRLVEIWEERRVFGSRARGLKELMLSSEPPPPLQLNKKRSRSVKIVRRDSRSIKIKLSVGGTAEKIVSAFHSVLGELPNEDADLNKCKSIVRRVGKMEKDVDAACARVGDPHRTKLAEELQEEENSLKDCIEKLKSVEANRLTLVLQLKQALQEQESELENIRTQIQVAQAQIEQAINMRKRLNNESPTVPPKPDSNGVASEPPKKSAAAIAAEVADKLAASTHSQQIMTSVLSTFAAEAAKNAVLTTSSSSAGNPSSAPKNNVKHEKAMISGQPTTPLPQYNLYPAPTQQYIQPSSVMIGVPYTYTTIPPLPPPPPQMMSISRPMAPLPVQQQQPMQPLQPPPMALVHQPAMPIAIQQLPMHMNQQPGHFGLLQPAPPSYRPLQPPNMGFYHHQTQ